MLYNRELDLCRGQSFHLDNYWCSELLAAHKPLVRFLLGHAHLEPEPEPQCRLHSSGYAAVPLGDEILAADVSQVAFQAGVSEEVARDALARNEYEIVAAVLDLAG